MGWKHWLEVVQVIGLWLASPAFFCVSQVEGVPKWSDERKEACRRHVREAVGDEAYERIRAQLERFLAAPNTFRLLTLPLASSHDILFVDGGGQPLFDHSFVHLLHGRLAPCAGQRVQFSSCR